jgi:HCOMODA/2-hydroxy-3-carboxy-muconic semialdehyde decarboxylase
MVLALAAATPAQAALTGDPVVDAAILDVVTANRILADQGVVDGYGHVSMRHPTNPNLFLLAKSKAPETVTSADVFIHDMNGNAINAPAGTTLYLERYIHSEIYKARPDVMAIVHAHAASILPFANTGVPLRPIYHMSSFLGTSVPVYDIAEFSSTPTDMLIDSPYIGWTLASVLGPNVVALQRGHGYVAVGGSVKQAVFRAYYTQVNAALQSQSIMLTNAANEMGVKGKKLDVTYLSPGEAAVTTPVIDGTIQRPWDLWKARVIANVK